MDQTARSDYTKKSKVIKELTGILVKNLETDRILLDQGREISRFIIDREKTINNDQDLIKFLDEVVNKWPIFYTVADNFKNQTTIENNTNQIKNEDVEKIEQIKLHLSKLAN